MRSDATDLSPLLGADRRGRGVPDRDLAVPPVGPAADRPAPPGAHRPALAADRRAAEDLTPARRTGGSGTSPSGLSPSPPMARRSRRSRRTVAWPCGTWRAAGAPRPSWTTADSPWTWRSPDGRSLAVCGLERDIFLYDVGAGRAGRPLGTPIQYGRVLGFSPDGRPWPRRFISTTRSCSGTSPRGGSGPDFGATDPPCSAWRSPPTAAPWPREAAAMRRSSSGTSPRAGRDGG